MVFPIRTFLDAEFIVADMLLIDVIPRSVEVVTESVIVALFKTVSPPDTVSIPPTVALLLIRTLSDSVVVPDTTSVVAERLVVVVADRVVNPDTLRLFWMVAAETVRSPLILAAFETLRDEMVVAAFPADILPITVKLFRTLADERVASPPTDAPEVVVSE
jgi:hypothetical protein